MGKYEGKRVVITGGTSGIGLATAKLLKEEGARLLLTGQTDKGIDSTRQELGSGAIVLKSDAASLTEIDALVEQAKTAFGAVDLLFLNAGITRWIPLELMTEEVYDQILSANAKGPYFTVQKFAPVMAENGAIVFTTSVVNEMGFPLVSAYAASKAALRSMARSFARELLSRGIRVNAVSPGGIDTGIVEKSLPKEAVENAKKQLIEGTPMKRLGTPDEIAKAVAFLAFDATFTTGFELAVDGGGSQL